VENWEKLKKLPHPVSGLADVGFASVQRFEISEF
jgi:hypothetical protein